MTTTIHKGNLTEERASGSDSGLTPDVPDTLLVPYRSQQLVIANESDRHGTDDS